MLLSRVSLSVGHKAPNALLQRIKLLDYIMDTATPEELLALGLAIVGFDKRRQENVSKKTNLSRFQSNFGFHPLIYAQIWHDLQTTTVKLARIDTSQRGVTLENFLYSLRYFKTYPTEEQMAGPWGYCEKIVRKWAWFFLGKIAALRVEKVGCQLSALLVYSSPCCRLMLLFFLALPPDSVARSMGLGVHY